MKRTIPFVFILFLIINYYSNTSTYAQAGDEYIAIADVMPEPEGGLAAINKLIVYPQIAQKAGVEGKVYVLAFINEHGGVDDVKVIKGIGAGCDEAVIDAVKKTKFKPGLKGGAPVKVKLTMAFVFKLTS
ncbi:energy transducer TonB [Melioribacteraceae bacterium 4301-Me]|uniref:energy transducer TonB n=1 Tax=Pyranulibacter aquaticus TaxID=3163344 RepID=UPI0035979E72